jgi:hypothetical protein
MTTKHDAYAAFVLADDIWQIALECRFGVAASDVRYIPAGKGEPGSDLRKAYEARESARIEWERFAFVA